MAKKFMNGIDLQSQRAINGADPSSATDLVTKQYADNLARGAKWKDPVRVASTANITVASALTNGSSIDGVTVATGDRVLLKNQSSAAENGIYVVVASGAASRSPDADSAGELAPGTAVYVTEGTANGDKAFTITSDAAITLGSTSITWGQFGGGTTYTASLGVQLSGTDFRANLGTGLTLSGNQIIPDSTVVTRKYAANIGDGSTTAIAVTHSLGTRDITVSVHDASTFEEIECDVVKTSTSVVTLTFATAPASNALRVTVHG